MDQPSLRDAIASFRIAQGPMLSSMDDETLISLLHDGDMEKAWFTLIARGTTTPHAVLSMIIGTRSLATVNREVPQMRRASADSFDRLRQAVELLDAHYGEAHLFKDNGSRSIRHHNDGVKQSRQALTWMRHDIERGRSAVDRAYELSFPTSRKRDSERRAFQVMLSDSLKFYFGQPFDGFVAAVSTAIYPSNDVVDLEATRKARTRETRRRSST